MYFWIGPISASVELISVNRHDAYMRTEPKIASTVLHDLRNETACQTLVRSNGCESSILQPTKTFIRCTNPQGTVGLRQKRQDEVARETFAAAILRELTFTKGC